MNHSQIAQTVRRGKEAHPEYYCPVPSCLWRTAGRVNGEFKLNVKPCRNHPNKQPTYLTNEAIADKLS